MFHNAALGDTRGLQALRVLHVHGPKHDFEDSTMGGITFQIVAYALPAGVIGVLAGWLLKGLVCDRRLLRLTDEWQEELDSMTGQRDRQIAAATALRSQLAEHQARLRKHELVSAQAKTGLDSARTREQQLSRDIFSMKGERDALSEKANTLQQEVRSLTQQAADLEAEFVKSRNVYTGELQKSVEQRHELEARLDNARLEHDSLTNLLESSRSEHDSLNRMLASARARLDNLDELEREVIRLEADNAQLNHDAKLAQREIDALKRDTAELDELKLQNQELAHCLESIENSRKQHESDARRYREHADEAEKKSATLRVRLEDMEQNFADIEKRQREALRDARNAPAVPKTNGEAPPPQEVDDLQEIVGIGKVFERALHDLGIRSFRQIAAFGPADIARINRELKECKGRLEQDDWIGQAKELLYRKYGAVQD